jgi:hypothetical protein
MFQFISICFNVLLSQRSGRLTFNAAINETNNQRLLLFVMQNPYPSHAAIERLHPLRSAILPCPKLSAISQKLLRQYRSFFTVIIQGMQEPSLMSRVG